jgi:hypothetical protein
MGPHERPNLDSLDAYDHRAASTPTRCKAWFAVLVQLQEFRSTALGDSLNNHDVLAGPSLAQALLGFAATPERGKHTSGTGRSPRPCPPADDSAGAILAPGAKPPGTRWSILAPGAVCERQAG